VSLKPKNGIIGSLPFRTNYCRCAGLEKDGFGVLPTAENKCDLA